jgi:hypothetical protein
MAKKAAAVKIVTNTSEAIRELFLAMGDVSSAEILDALAQQGVQCSVSLIESIRKKMKQAKTLTVTKAAAKKTAAKRATGKRAAAKAPQVDAKFWNQWEDTLKKAAPTRKTLNKKPAAKKKPAIKPGTIAFQVSSVWGGLEWMGVQPGDTVASLKAWLEQEARDIQNAIEVLEKYDDDANPFTTQA